VPLDQRHTGRVFRDFLAIASLARGTEAQLQDRLRAHGGIVLMVDGVQFDDRAPVLYLAWDSLSGTPLFGERRPFRGEDDLVPILERGRAMDVPLLGIVTDKEKGLVPAVIKVFPKARYQFCHTHFLKNCAKPMQPDLQKLTTSVARRAEGVREIDKELSQRPASPAAKPLAPSCESASGDATPPASAPSTDATTLTRSDASAVTSAAPTDTLLTPPASDATTSGSPAAAASLASAASQTPPPMTELELAREICDLVRANSRVSGKAPLDPPELERHHRLERIRALVNEAQEKSLPDAGPGGWSLLDRLAHALELTWHDARTAGRVARHTDRLRDLAHEPMASAFGWPRKVADLGSEFGIFPPTAVATLPVDTRGFSGSRRLAPIRCRSCLSILRLRGLRES